MSENRSITVSRTVSTAPAQALRGFTHPTMLRDWLCDTSATAPNPGGALFLGWKQGYTVSGIYTRLEMPALVEFSWQGLGDPGTTRVAVTAQAVEAGTRLELVHSGLGDGPAWDKLAERWSKDWQAALENLQSVLETGVDLRQAHRPRLGIMFNEFTPEKAARLGVPVTKGILLDGTAEGSGARKAGLQKDDVLVSLNGVALETFDSFEPALRGLQAGDCPAVEYYRGAEKSNAAIELGYFPLPEYPAEPAGLAALVKERTSASLASLREHLSGLSETEAEQIPTEGEWSVKEIIAHLVLTERDYQAWVAHMLNDTPVEDWLQISPNVTPRVKALAARLNSLEALLAELQAILGETIAMLGALPAEFSNDRKHLYRRAAGWAIEVTPGHYLDEHKDQISAAISAARA